MKKQLLILSCKHLLDKLHFIVIFIIILSMALLYKIFYLVLICYLIYLYKNKLLNKLGYIIIILYSLSLFLSYKIIVREDIKNINGICYVIDRKDNLLTINYQGKNYYFNTFTNLAPGDFIKVEAKTIKRDTISYEGDNSKILNDSSKYIYGELEGKILSKEFSIYTFKRIKYNILTYFKDKIDEDTYDFIFSLVLGKSLNVDSINKLNLSHILVVSGFHLSLIYSFSYFIIFKLIKKPNLSEKITLVIITIYSLLCGMHISLIRALIMIYINYFNNKTKLLTKLDVFSLTFLIILIKPLYIYNISFILSFLASFTIMYLKEFNTEKESVFKKLKDNLLIFLVMLPVITNFSNYFSLFFIFSFIFVDYFCYLLIPLSFLSLIFNDFLNIFSVFLNSIMSLINYLSSNLIFNIPYMNIYIKLIYYILLIVLVLFSKKKLSKILFFVILTIFSFKFYFTGENITFIDVKQGDSTLIKDEEATYLVDAHNCFNFLSRSGVKKLDAIFISHEDYDHISDLEKILKNIKVDYIYTSIYCKNIRDICINYNINFKMLKTNDKLNIGSDYIKVISPFKDYKESNANSLVLEINHLNKKILFTGDLTKEVELDLIKNNLLNKVDVLKVGHHGSNTSSSKEFLDVICPSYSIVSVSNKNKYNLPNSEIIKRLKEYSVVYLTSKNGNIVLKNNVFKTFK